MGRGGGERPDAETEAALKRPLKPEPLLSVLKKHKIDFIVVGGYAVAAHGSIRATKDIDICPEPSAANLQRVADALQELEAELIGIEDFEKGELGIEPNPEGLKVGGNWVMMTRFGRLDVMQHIDGLGDGGGGWAELRPQAVVKSFLGHDCLFCSYRDLIKMKQAAGRPQDLVDLQNLKAARSEL